MQTENVCPRINYCEKRVTQLYYKTYCMDAFKLCDTYIAFHMQKPSEWKRQLASTGAASATAGSNSTQNQRAEGEEEV